MADDEILRCRQADCQRETVMTIGTPGHTQDYCVSHALQYMEYATRILASTLESVFVAKIKKEFGI